MSDLRAAAELLRLIDGFKISQAIFTAAALGVADVIVGGAGTSDAIADEAGADREAMYRLLRALAAHGVLREDDGRRFSLTPMGECLRTDAEFPLAPHARLMGQAHYQEAWGQLIHSVKTGENAFLAVHGMTNWAYRDAHPDQRRLFAAAMTANSRRVDAAIVPRSTSRVTRGSPMSAAARDRCCAPSLWRARTLTASSSINPRSSTRPRPSSPPRN